MYTSDIPPREASTSSTESATSSLPPTNGDNNYYDEHHCHRDLVVPPWFMLVGSLWFSPLSSHSGYSCRAIASSGLMYYGCSNSFNILSPKSGNALVLILILLALLML